MTPFCLLAKTIALYIGTLLVSAGCASHPERGASIHQQANRLRAQLQQLDPSVNPSEASRLATVALEESIQLAKQYRAVKPAWLHNWLVNYGQRERGLCFDWTNDLYSRLHALGAHTLDLHLAVALMDTRREHNCIVVTARGQPFKHGLVLDAWRHSGRLWFGPVASDKYPWRRLPRDRVPPELDPLVPK